MLPKLTIDYSINGSLMEGLVAHADVLPGMLLERHVSSISVEQQSYANQVSPHSIINGKAFPLVAVERPDSNLDIDTLIKIGEVVSYRYCLPGDIFIGIVGGEDPMNITAGTLLSSNGDGKLHPIPEGEMLQDRTVIGYALATPHTDEMYSYFAINGVKLSQVYARVEDEYYLVSDEIVMLSDRIAVEVI